MNTSARFAALSVAGTAVAIALAMAYILGARHSDAALDAMAFRLDKIENQQKLFADAYLTRNVKAKDDLAQSMGYKRMAQAPLSGSADVPGRNVSPENIQRMREKSKARFEKEFASEPLDPAWAGTMTHDVQDAIVDIAADGGPTPLTTQVDCRSSTCRIQLDLSDTGEVDGFLDPLLVKISQTLPNARTVEVPSSDGRRVELHIFATKGSRQMPPPRS